MAWRRLGDKPLPEPMMVRLPTHICGTQPQWVKCNKAQPSYIFLGLLYLLSVIETHKLVNIVLDYWGTLFTRGQFWPSGIVIACVCVCVCVRVHYRNLMRRTFFPDAAYFYPDVAYFPDVAYYATSGSAQNVCFREIGVLKKKKIFVAYLTYATSGKKHSRISVSRVLRFNGADGAFVFCRLYGAAIYRRQVKTAAISSNRKRHSWVQ